MVAAIEYDDHAYSVAFEYAYSYEIWRYPSQSRIWF